jgi:hypothetical protein
LASSVSYAFSVKARAPLKVLGRVGLRAKRGVNGDLSGEAASVHPPDGVDEQISMLLQSLEVELSETGLPRPASRPPNSKPTSPGPVVHEQPTESTLDRRPPAPARTRRRALVKGRGLDQPRAHTRMRRRLVSDPATRGDVLFLIIAVLLGIGVGLAIALSLGS